MSMRQRQKLSSQALDEATQWFVELREDSISRSVREGFDGWLRISPENVRAYLQIASHWEEGGGRALSIETLEELIAMARGDGNVASLPGAAGLARVRTRRGNEPGAAFRFAALAAAVMLMVVAGALMWDRWFRHLYSTDVGEQRSLILADGSSVELNARSSIRIHYSGSERRIDLLAGQALFQVAYDAARPFIVLSGETQVRALGTQFDVYRRRSGTTITVLEGRVAVSRNAASAASAHFAAPTLAAGEQLTATRDSVGKPRAANLTAAVAWTQHRLIFSGASLAEVVEEFNRYNSVPLVIAEPALGETLVSGSFSSSDPASLLRFLQDAGTYRIEEGRGAVYISGR